MKNRQYLPHHTRILRLLCVCWLLPFLIACQSSTAQPTLPRRPGTQQPPPLPTTTPQHGGTVTIGVPSNLQQINPAFGTDPLASSLLRPVVEGLFDFDPTGRPRPWLAESVPGPGRGISADGRTIILRLRQGVAWEDGQPFGAADLVFTLAVGKNAANPFDPEIAAAYNTIRDAEALDPYTVRLNLYEPGNDYLYAFSPIFPAHIFHGTSDLANHPYTRAPFGTGPFRLGEWVPGKTLTLVRSPSYRLNDRPYLDQLIFQSYPDLAAAEAALQARTIDLILSDDGQRVIARQNEPLRGVNPQPNVPPTWNIGDWSR